jgi:hypothetical protein
MSIGAIAGGGLAVVTGLGGYGFRVLQDWRADRTRRDDRQREIAGAAQIAADRLVEERRAADRSMREGYRTDAQTHSEKSAENGRDLERHAANLRDPAIAPLVQKLLGAIDEHYRQSLPWEDVEAVHAELRARLSRFFHD